MPRDNRCMYMAHVCLYGPLLKIVVFNPWSVEVCFMFVQRVLWMLCFLFVL